jgi:catechol 2,3-dioxygenase-like lactoylglutathione lyase family enzyme
VRLAFTYNPVSDVKQALAFYRDTLGWTEAWRAGDTTVAFTIPGTDIQFMVDSRARGEQPGPAFLVDSVLEFRRAHGDRLTFTAEPRTIPGGHWASFLDPDGKPVYLLDQSA